MQKSYINSLYNLIENDKYNPTLALCISLAKVLQTDLNTLFWESENLEGEHLK